MNGRTLLALLATLVLGLVLGSAFMTGAGARAPLRAAATPHETAGAALDEATIERIVNVLEALEKRLATELPKSALASSGAPAQRIDLDTKDEPNNDELERLLQGLETRLGRSGGSTFKGNGQSFGFEPSESRKDWLTLRALQAPINFNALERFFREHESEGEVDVGPDLYFYELRDFIRDFGWPSEIQRHDVASGSWELSYKGLSIPYAYLDTTIRELNFDFENGQLNWFDYRVD